MPRGDNNDDDDIEDEPLKAPIRQSAPTQGYDDLYLDTIDRNVLDFDFEKLCSVSLSNINVYACLVCGRYYQGRGPKSHAYFHALDEDHHVFINMETQRVYVLPEGYEVQSKSLDDIKYVANPRYDRKEVMALDRPPRQDGGGTGAGGGGAFSDVLLRVTPGETLGIVVGGGGAAGTYTYDTPVVGAYGGGGAPGMPGKGGGGMPAGKLKGGGGKAPPGPAPGAPGAPGAPPPPW